MPAAAGERLSQGVRHVSDRQRLEIDTYRGRLFRVVGWSPKDKVRSRLGKVRMHKGAHLTHIGRVRQLREPFEDLFGLEAQGRVDKDLAVGIDAGALHSI